MLATAEVSLPSDTQIRVTRDFNAPRSLVYLAFTKPDLVRRWLLGPPGWSMPVCEIDLRVGGSYRYRWRNDGDGRSFGLRGTFDGIRPEAQIASRESFEDAGPAGEAHIDTRFADHGAGRTRVTYLITAESKEARDAAIATGMTDGMEMSFKALDGVLGAESTDLNRHGRWTGPFSAMARDRSLDSQAFSIRCTPEGDLEAGPKTP
jgi:uncharacterized protein YndB with AHSA1/START domain